MRGKDTVNLLLGRDRIHELPQEITLAENVPLFTLRGTSEVVLPEGLVSVGRSWFAGSRVQRVRFPFSVAELGCWAFAECEILEEVVF